MVVPVIEEGAEGCAVIATLQFCAGAAQPFRVAIREYLPAAARLTLGITGFCCVEVKLLGPVHLYVAPAIVVAVKIILSPSQSGLLLVTTGLLNSHSEHICFHEVAMKILIQFVVVLKIRRPVAGETIALRCVVLILGTSNPCVFELISTFAEGSGTFVPMPTP